MLNRLRQVRLLPVSLIWLCCMLSCPVRTLAVTADATDDALREICQRGLATIAVEYCRNQVTLHAEKGPLRSRWFMRQMECQCQAALQAGPDQAGTNQARTEEQQEWEALSTLESEYRREFADDPRLPWLAWQLSRGELLRAQQSLARWLATPAAQAQRENALQAVRRIQSQLDALDSDIKARLPLTLPKAGSPPSQVASRELQELSIDGGLLRCESMLVRARCYPISSPDRLAALSEVERLAGEMLSRAQPDWPSRDELIVAAAAAGLEVGKRAESLKTLTAILSGANDAASTSASLPSSQLPIAAGTLPTGISRRTRLRAGTVAIEAHCVDKNLTAAQRLQQELKQNFSGPEVELSQIQVQLAQWEQLPPRDRAQQISAIAEAAQQLGTRYGAYWRNRAEALLVAAANAGSSSVPIDTDPDSKPNTNPGTPSTIDRPPPTQDLVQIEVRQLLAGGQVEAAIARLRQATLAAKKANDASQTLDYAIEAARLMQREKQWQQAADLLEPLALEWTSDSNAAAAHVLAAWCIAQALQQKDSSSDKPPDKSPKKQLEDRYERMLRAQLKLWPVSSHSIKAEEYLVGWLTRQKRFDELCQLWLDRAEQTAAASQGEVALTALQHWQSSLIGRLPKAQVTAQIQRLIDGIDANKYESCQRSAVIIAFSAAMLTAPLTKEEAETLVRQKLPGQQLDQNTTDQAALAAIGALAAARRGDANAAHSALQVLDLEQLDSIVHLAWCKAMAEALDELPASKVADWNAVLELVQWPVNQPPTTVALKMADLRLKQLRTKDAGESASALAAIKELATQHASDANVQLVYAAALAQSASGNSGAYDEAIRTVKRVSTGASKQSDAYLRARWLEIQWRMGRGEKRSAVQIARLTLATQAIEPAWWKKRLEAIAALE